MHKPCPFCKKEVGVNSAVCPHCTTTLRETVSVAKSNYDPQQKQCSASKDNESNNKKKSIPFFKLQIDKLKKNILRNKAHVFGANKDDRYKRYILTFLAILFFIGVYTKNDQKPAPGEIISVIPNTEENQSTQIKNNVTEAKDPSTYFSLPNGTIFSQNSLYLNGSGKLIINNGTSSDAIAKLVNTTINKSVFTVYIKAKSVYTVREVKDGNYKLFFNLGNDWDTERKAFTVNSSYEVFEDLLEFNTRDYEEGDYIYTEYSTFEVTFNPVIGGTAETENVKPTEFAQY